LLNNWTESFRIINAFLLTKASSNKTRLISLNTAIHTTFILYTHRLPITFIEGWKGTKDQVLLKCKAWILSCITPCHMSYLSALENAMGLEVGEDITWEIGATEEATDAMRRVVFDNRRWRIIGCCRAVDRGGEEYELGSC